MIARWVPIPWPYHEPDAQSLIDASVAGWQDGTAAHFAIVREATDEVVGAITRYGPSRSAATIGRRSGTGSRLLRVVKAWRPEP